MTGQYSPDDAVSGTASKAPGVGLAFLTYAFLLFIRASGLSGFFRYANPRNPLFGIAWLRDVGEFVFYDYILLAAIGLVSSGILLALVIASSQESDYSRAKLIAATGVGLPALAYIVGSILIAIG